MDLAPRCISISTMWVLGEIPWMNGFVIGKLQRWDAVVLWLSGTGMDLWMMKTLPGGDGDGVEGSSRQDQTGGYVYGCGTLSPEPLNLPTSMFLFLHSNFGPFLLDDGVDDD